MTRPRGCPSRDMERLPLDSFFEPRGGMDFYSPGVCFEDFLYLCYTKIGCGSG